MTYEKLLKTASHLKCLDYFSNYIFFFFKVVTNG